MIGALVEAQTLAVPGKRAVSVLENVQEERPSSWGPRMSSTTVSRGMSTPPAVSGICRIITSSPTSRLRPIARWQQSRKRSCCGLWPRTRRRGMRIAVLIKVEHEGHDAARTCEQELLSNCNGCAKKTYGKGLWKTACRRSYRHMLLLQALRFFAESAVLSKETVGLPTKLYWVVPICFVGINQNLYILFCLAFWKTISTGETYSGQCCRHLMGQRACRIHGTKLKGFRRLLEH